MRVLIVEDDEAQRLGIRSLFRKGDKITALAKSSDAVNVVCDVAVIDLMIQDDISGTTLAKHLKHNNPNAVVIIYTALESGQHWREANIVADSVITKRHDLHELRELINAAVSRGAK